MFGHTSLGRTLEAALRDVTNARVEVRVSAAGDLGRHVADDRSGRAALALRDALASDQAPAVRAAAAVAMADSGQRSFVEALLRAAADPVPHVAEMALLALGELGAADHPRVTEVVSGALASDAPALRFQSLLAAHKLGLSVVENALSRAIQDPDPEVRHVALRVLEERATSEEGDVALTPAVTALALALVRDPAFPVRLAAAILLARAGDLRGATVLAEAVESTGPMDPEDEQAAVVLAGELRVEAARKGLERRSFRGLFGRPRFSYEARIALARLGDARARRAIARGLSAWSRDARTLAVVAAGHAELTEVLPAIESMRGDPRRAEPDAVELSLRLLRERGA